MRSNPISEAQLTANRANAQHSSGPRTEAGKAASSQNRRQYGLTGVFVVLPEEDENEYMTLFESLRKDCKPANEVEELLVRKMAQHQWQADRALYHQANSFYKEDFFAFEKQISLFMRYHTMHDRAFHRALTELRKVQKERREQELKVPELKARAIEVGLDYEASRIDVNHSKAQQIKAKTAQIGFESKKQSGAGSQPAAASQAASESTAKEHPAAA